ILCPLPDIAHDVVKTEVVRRLRSHRVSLTAGIALVPGMVVCTRVTVTPPEPRRRPRTRRVFPFRFAGQPIGAVTRGRDQPTHLDIQPANIGSRIPPT